MSGPMSEDTKFLLLIILATWITLIQASIFVWYLAKKAMDERIEALKEHLKEDLKKQLDHSNGALEEHVYLCFHDFEKNLRRDLFDSKDRFRWRS
jgi:hypothetical protein